MPVSATLLLSQQEGSGGVGPGPHLVRQQPATSSVRLRKRKDEAGSGAAAARRNNRHSGDFSFFPAGRAERRESGPAWQTETGRLGEPDWNYITFPNGVPLVQEVKIGMNSNSQKEAGPAPVKVTMREAPALTPIKQRSNLNANRVVSASVMNIQEQQNFAKRKSGDFSHCDSHNYRPVNSEMEESNVRRRPHARSHSQQPNRSSQPAGPSQCRQGDRPASQHTPTRAPPLPPAPTRNRKEADNVAKRCSGEFEFKKMYRRSGDFNQLSQVLSQELDKAEEQSIVERMISRELQGDAGSDGGSAESGIFSTGSSQESPKKEVRRPGLGRRAITQVNMRDRDRKNSYNNALAKSQENLVKVGD